MSVEFSQIPAKLNYPRHLKGKLSSLHSDVITYVSGIYDGSHDLRTKTIRLLNTITQYIIEGDSLPINWSSAEAPFENIDIEDEFTLKSSLEKLYINPREIHWDIPIVAEKSSSIQLDEPIESSKTVPIVPTVKNSKAHQKMKVKISPVTKKEDLYIQSPLVPQFDVKKPWIRTVIDGSVYCVYESIPSVPTKQNEISVTTKVNMMSESQLLNLYPHNFIRTRSPVLYEAHAELKHHSQLGTLLPVEGFTDDEIIDNIIKYPHLYRLLKMRDGQIVNFYNTIEIDGELHKVSEVWKKLPDTSQIPYTVDFVKEYVVRRYLLERDHKHIQHKYPLYGELDPFLTLFTTTSDYIRWGYMDVVDIARKCVESRVAYKRSRNPVIRRVENA